MIYVLEGRCRSSCVEELVNVIVAEMHHCVFHISISSAWLLLMVHAGPLRLLKLYRRYFVHPVIYIIKIDAFHYAFKNHLM